MKLTASARNQLRRISNGPRIYLIGSSTLQALETKGLIKGRELASERPAKEYVITPAGRAILRAEGETP